MIATRHGNATLHYTITYRDGTQEVVFILEDANHIPLKEEKI
jgi:hypothetical protein